MTKDLVSQLRTASTVLSSLLVASAGLKDANEEERSTVIDNLSDVIKRISLELGTLMGTSAKQSLSTVMEYDLSKYVNAAYGRCVLKPCPGTRGADADWVDGKLSETVEQKASEVSRAKNTKRGRIFTSSTVSIYDWELQLLRDRFNWGLHNDQLQYEAAIMISKVGVTAMFDAAAVKYGMPEGRRVVGSRSKASFTVKDLMTICPPQSMTFIVGGEVVDRKQFIVAFFGDNSPLLE